MRRDIVLLGEEVLRRKCKPVATVDAVTRRLIDDMVATMEAANGVGLAAPQVGVAKRILVAADEDEIHALINPKIISRSGRETGTEGCLSIPGLFGAVPRARRVVVTGLDRSGRQVRIEAEGWLARIFQHELDHLNGVLFIDHTKELWWTVEVEDDAEELADHEAEPAGEVDADEEDEDGVRFRRIPTTLAEVTAHFDELREQGQTRRRAGSRR